MSTHEYPGNELALFAQARNWKRYVAGCLHACMTGEVLEVGAGLGEMTRMLCDGRQAAWVCLEPDPNLAARLARAFPGGLAHGVPIKVVPGTLSDLAPGRRFDCILYMDVLEHIADDRAELAQAAARLRPGGCLVVLSPAHQALFSAFDRAIGHHRRYDRRMLRAIAPPGLVEARLCHLDAAGMLCSLANRVVLRRAQPRLHEILFWDRMLVPLSRVLDALLMNCVGRSILGVWHAPRAATAVEGSA